MSQTHKSSILGLAIRSIDFVFRVLRRLADAASRTAAPAEQSMSTPSHEIAQQYIEIWKKAVETQMHFNEMSVKSRQLGLTFVAGALGLGIVLLSRGEAFSFPIELGPIKFQLNIAVLLPIAALLALRAVKQLDLNVYHKMLRGAVTFGEDFENAYMTKIFDLEKGMTQAISHFSRFSDASVMTPPGSVKYAYCGNTRGSAEGKILEFYGHAEKFLWITAAILLLITNVAYWNKVYFEPHRASAVEPTASKAALPHEPDAKANPSEAQSAKAPEK
jgi:hypothetical protein